MTRAFVLILAAGLLSACGDTDTVSVAPTFLDGQYYVKSVSRKQHCTFTEGKDLKTDMEPSNGVVDVLAHPFDGKHDFRSTTYAIPSLHGFTLGAFGKVKHDQPDEESPGEGKSLEGKFTQDGFRLKLTENYVTEGFSACTITSQLVGTKRPLTDPEAVDGLYDAYVETGANACPATNQFENDMVSDLDILDTGDGKWEIALEGGYVWFKPENIGAVLEYEKSVEVLAYDGTGVLVTTKAEGLLNAPKAMFTLMTGTTSPNGAVCGQMIKVFGDKRIPDPAKIENDYRVRYRIEATDGCGVTPAVGHAIASVATGLDGRLLLTDYLYTRHQIKAEPDGSFASTEPLKLAYNAVRHYEGTVGGGKIHYRIVTAIPAQRVDYVDRPACTITVHADGLLRFVEVE